MRRKLIGYSIVFALIISAIGFSYPLIEQTSVHRAKAAGNTYYVRADGSVSCANKANATSPNAAGTSLNMAQVNACTFSAGDQVL